MKKKLTIMIGCFLSVFLMLSMSSVSAIEYHTVKEKEINFIEKLVDCEKTIDDETLKLLIQVIILLIIDSIGFASIMSRLGRTTFKEAFTKAIVIIPLAAIIHCGLAMLVAYIKANS